jgi:hypothetical protein
MFVLASRSKKEDFVDLQNAYLEILESNAGLMDHLKTCQEKVNM